MITSYQLNQSIKPFKRLKPLIDRTVENDKTMGKNITVKPTLQKTTVNIPKEDIMALLTLIYQPFGRKILFLLICLRV
jgi:hypothetical protein